MPKYPIAALAACAIALPVAGQPAAPPAPPAAAAAAPMTPAQLSASKKANGSLYVQCDGQPDNMTGGETAARVIGAIALIGLLAPAPEAPDPAKRKFGADGVAACSTLIEGAQRESNAERRFALILARGAHRIEAKDYPGAIADAALARAAAAAGGLAADPYWQRSRGRAPDVLEAAALYRLGRPDEANALQMRGHGDLPYAALTLIGMMTYQDALPTLGADEQALHVAASHSHPLLAAIHADRLEQAGRFADAAVLRDALLDYNRAVAPKAPGSRLMAEAAITHALAGDAARAADLAREAQANFDRRRAEGNPDPEPSDVVEELDLYNVIRLAGSGDVKAARRLYAARSRWLAPGFGATLEVSRRLRAGAAPDELIGGLERDPAALRKARADETLATLLKRDADNRSLFAFPATVRAADYEGVAKAAWKVDKSPWVLKRKPGDTTTEGFDLLFNYAGNVAVMPQAYTLHAALLAKARGHRGFVIRPIVTGQLLAAQVRTGNPGDPGLPAPLFNDADQVVATLSPLIPDPATLKARQEARRSR